MTQKAVVIRIIGPGLCEVRVRRRPACAGDCASCPACKTESSDVLALNRAGALEGDSVLIEGSGTLPLAALVYIAPVFLFLLGWFIHPMAGLAGVMAGAAAVLLVNRYLQERGGVTARVVSVLRDKEQC